MISAQSTFIFRTVWSTLVYFFLYLPILVLVMFSFNDSRYSLQWHGFTLQWYKVLFDNPALWLTGAHSIIIALLSSSIATIIGTLAAVNLYRYRFMGRQLLYAFIFVLLISPDIVTGVSLLMLFDAMKLPLGFWSLLLAHITFIIPFAFVTIYGSMAQIDKNLFEAAKDLGASEYTLLKKIIIPLIKPAIFASALLGFTLSFDDVMISYFVAGPSFDILPLRIFSMARLGIKPDLNALCSLILGFTLIMILLAHKMLRKKS